MSLNRLMNYAVSAKRFSVMSVFKVRYKRFRTLTAESFLREVEIELAHESVVMNAVALPHTAESAKLP